MNLLLAVILSVFVSEDSGESIPIAEFPNEKMCGDVIPYMIYESKCTPTMNNTAPVFSIRPKRNPAYE